jgi:hypothetical protein
MQAADTKDSFRITPTDLGQLLFFWKQTECGVESGLFLPNFEGYVCI